MVSQAAGSRGDGSRPVMMMGLVFELDNLALPGRKVMYDTLSRVLKDKDAALTAALFTRYCLVPTPALFLPALFAALDKKKWSPEKMAAEVTEQFVGALPKASKAVPEALASILADAAKHKVVVGAVSGLPDGVAAEALERLGLAESVRLNAISNPSVHFPTPDCWLALAKSMGLSARRCTALVTHAVACKSALAAGMRVVVVPDEFTGFQDFGGCDILAESLKDVSLKECLALLKPCSFR